MPLASRPSASRPSPAGPIADPCRSLYSVSTRPLALAVATLVVVALAPRIAVADITPAAQVIVDRYLAATGGAEALAAERSLHTKRRLSTLGLKGTVEQWSAVPDRIVTRFSLGTLKHRTGSDGQIGWETDLASRSVRRLEGSELDLVRAEAYFANEMWARPDQGGGRVVVGSSSFRDGDEVHSLDVTPPAGPSRRLWFSGKKGLVTRIVTHGDQFDSDLYLSEYKAIHDRRRATHEGASPELLAIFGDRLGPEQAVLDSVWVNTAFDSALFAPPASSPGKIEWLATRGTARVPFRFGDRHVWVKVSINGSAPLDFLIDTGASTTAIDRDAARRLGLVQEGRITVQGMGGADHAALARLRSIRLGQAKEDGVVLRDLAVSVVDLGGEDSEVTRWRRMDGLIGYDILGQFAVEIDYDRRLVTLNDPKTFAYKGSGETLDMRLDRGVPVVKLRLNADCTGDFLVDVGNAFGVIVHGSMGRNCGFFRGKPRKEIQITGGGVGASFASWLCRMDSLSLGGLRVREPIVGLSLSTRGMVGSQELAGNIGSGMLERFRCTFDYARGRLHLEPGLHYAEPDRYSRAGVFLARFPQRVVASQVMRGSPADEAGLEVFDEVVEIDGKSALVFTPEELDRLFTDGEIGSTHTLTILRDGRRSKLELKLKDVI